jgi:hypothetical protein
MVNHPNRGRFDFRGAEISNEAIAQAADACWQIYPTLKAALRANSDSYVQIKRGDIAGAIGHCQLGLTPEMHRRLVRLFSRELSKRVD